MKEFQSLNLKELRELFLEDKNPKGYKRDYLTDKEIISLLLDELELSIRFSKSQKVDIENLLDKIEKSQIIINILQSIPSLQELENTNLSELREMQAKNMNIPCSVDFIDNEGRQKTVKSCI